MPIIVTVPKFRYIEQERVDQLFSEAIDDFLDDCLEGFVLDDEGYMVTKATTCPNDCDLQDGCSEPDSAPEVWVEYDFPERSSPYTIYNPQYVSPGESGHYILDGSGITHYVPFSYGVVVRSNDANINIWEV